MRCELQESVDEETAVGEPTRAFTCARTHWIAWRLLIQRPCALSSARLHGGRVPFVQDLAEFISYRLLSTTAVNDFSPQAIASALWSMATSGIRVCPPLPPSVVCKEFIQKGGGWGGVTSLQPPPSPLLNMPWVGGSAVEDPHPPLM